MKNKFKPEKSFSFEEEGHAYSRQGKQIFSVSNVLEKIFPFKGNRNFIGSLPLLRGKYIHKCIEMEMEGTLDIDQLDEPEYKIMFQFRGFLCKEELKFQKFISEIPMYHQFFKYGFTADIFFENGLLVDVKTGKYIAAEREKMQLIAYAEGLKSWGYKIKKMMIVRLSEIGYIPEIHEFDKNVFRRFISELKKIKGEKND